MGSGLTAGGSSKKTFPVFGRKLREKAQKHGTITEEEIMAGYEKIMSYRYMLWQNRCI